MNHQDEEGKSAVEAPYSEVILSRISGINSLSETILIRTNALCGRNIPPVGSTEKEKEPSSENFCETTLRNLRIAEDLLREALENLGRM